MEGGGKEEDGQDEETLAFSCCGGGNARQFSDFGNLLRQIFRVGILVNLPITSAHVQIWAGFGVLWVGFGHVGKSGSGMAGNLGYEAAHLRVAESLIFHPSSSAA